jgi:hypothetical protein
MIADGHLQNFPERSGFACYDMDLVSCEVPSGAAWLVNCLLELDISVWKPWATDDREHWQHINAMRYRYVGDHGWARVLPALVDGREFTFRNECCVRAHHAWPDQFPAVRKTILFVRDPRDALYSAWHRLKRFGAIPLDQDFPSFCESRYHHYPISWQDYVLLFMRIWLRKIERIGGGIVRFEDYRRDAQGTLARAISSIGITATPSAITRAVEASTVDRVRLEDQRLLSSGIVPTLIVRGEPPGEHTRHLDEATLRKLDHRFADICESLGYSRTHEEKSLPAFQGESVFHGALVDALRTAGADVGEGSWFSNQLRDATKDIGAVAIHDLVR